MFGTMITEPSTFLLSLTIDFLLFLCFFFFLFFSNFNLFCRVERANWIDELFQILTHLHLYIYKYIYPSVDRLTNRQLMFVSMRVCLYCKKTVDSNSLILAQIDYNRIRDDQDDDYDDDDDGI